MKYPYGGQALIEGVMMNGRENSAIAVRKADGTISVKMEKLNRIGDKYKFLKWPFIRGSVNLVESMVVGFKALTHSANESAELTDKAENVLGVIQVIGTVVAVVMLMVIGIKYMLGSVEERAEYKDTLKPYLIGAFLLFSGATIPQIIYKIAQNL